jgi:hypothetical protein
MDLKDRLRKREKAVVWHLLDGAAGSGMRRGLYTIGPATVHTASKQRLASCVTTTLTRRALCDISFGHLIIV